MLKVEELSVFYGDYQAVKGISFEVGQGELVTFIGANGAGKTSTIRALLGLVEGVKGRIRFRRPGREPGALACAGQGRNAV